MIDFVGYKTNVPEATTEKGAFLVSCDALMREIISTANKNNDAEEYDCGDFSYQTSSTKGGALCYGIQEDGYDVGINVSFYRDKDGEKSVKSYEDIPKSISIHTATNYSNGYDSSTALLLNASLFQVVGDVTFDQGYSDYKNKVEDATGYSSLNFYTNEMELNGFDVEYSVITDDDNPGVAISFN